MGLLYDKIKKSTEVGSGSPGVGGALYQRAQQASGTQKPNVSTPTSPADVNISSKLPKSLMSPLALTGPTTLQAAPKPGFIEAAAKAAFDTVNNSITSVATHFGDLLSTFGPGEKNPYGTDYTKETGLTIGMTPKQRQTFYENQAPEHSTLNRAVKLGEFGLSLVNLYPPIAQFNAELAAAKQLPGPLSVPAHAVDWGFQKVSELGTKAMGAGIDELKDHGVISPETADTIKPLTQDLAGFATLVVGSHFGFKAMEKGLGGVEVDPVTGERKATGIVSKLPISDTAQNRLSNGVKIGTGLSMQPFSTAFGLAQSMIVTKIHEKQAAGEDVTPEVGKQIVEEVAQAFPRAHEDYAKSQGYEPYTPADKLPVIDMGPKAKDTSGLPVIQMDAPTPNAKKALGDITIEPVKQKTINPQLEPKVNPIGTQLETPPADNTVVPETRTTKVPKDQLPVGSKEGKTRVSRLEARMSGKLDSIDPAQAEAMGISTFEQMNKKEQKAAAAEYVDKTSNQEILDVLSGKKPAPDGLLHNSIAIAAEAKAEMDGGDAGLARKLASLRSTRHGQEISMLTEADPTNAVSAMHEIVKARQESANRRNGGSDQTTTKATKKEATDAALELHKKRLKIEDAQSLLNKILC